MAECARRSGKFWEFHDLAFEKQRELGNLDPTDLAVAVGLEKPSSAACALDSQAADVVDRDSKEAARLGVRGTPTFFVGRVRSDSRVDVVQRMVGAQAVEAFRAAVAEARPR